VWLIAGYTSLYADVAADRSAFLTGSAGGAGGLPRVSEVTDSQGQTLVFRRFTHATARGFPMWTARHKHDSCGAKYAARAARAPSQEALLRRVRGVETNDWHPGLYAYARFTG
jgi:hypothetical protein